MKLGTQTASLMNHIHSRAVIGQPEPTIGMGATILGWTDRNPATVVNVFRTGKSLYVVTQDDSYRRIDENGMSESQEYEYTPNPNGGKRTFRRADDGQWHAVALNDDTGRYVKTGGNGLRIGEREKYHDFSF